MLDCKNFHDIFCLISVKQNLNIFFHSFLDLSLDIPLKPKSTQQKTKANPSKVCHLTGLCLWQFFSCQISVFVKCVNYHFIYFISE